jgi:hypothetical protein
MTNYGINRIIKKIKSFDKTIDFTDDKYSYLRDDSSIETRKVLYAFISLGYTAWNQIEYFFQEYCPKYLSLYKTNKNTAFTKIYKEFCYKAKTLNNE